MSASDPAPSFAAAIRRSPLPLDAEAEAGRAALGHLPDQPAEIREVLIGAAGASPYLRDLMRKEGTWLAQALAEAPDTVMPALLAETAGLEGAAVGPGLRQFKRRMALYVGLADLAGVWDLATVTAALTDFADLSVDLALKAALAGPLARGKVPGHGIDALPDAAGICVLAMGKMGAHELNYSSDIDLIVLFDDARFADADLAEARATFIKVTRAMTATLSEMTSEGYVWRTDLRLRPDPSVTPVCLSMEAAERYYESLGRTWERAAHIKARPCAGDIAAGERYLDRLAPFVWRRHLDYAAVQDADDMRRRIRDHKGLHGDEDRLEGRDLKLGRGGIREIEFFTQTRQLIAGGRDPGLRARGTIAALGQLAGRGWVPHEVKVSLSDHYAFLREAEHRLQIVGDARTQKMPAKPEEIDRIARLSGHARTRRYTSELMARMAEVHGLTEDFFTGGSPGAPAPQRGAEPEIVARWRHYPALRSRRAQAIFERLKPDLLARFAEADRPDEALSAFDGFLRGLPAGVQLFAMFEANPRLRALIVDIAATAPALAAYLSRNSRVLEAVVSGAFFAPWPGRAALIAAATDAIAAAEDYEDKLDAARRWAKEWHFRAGVHHLRGLTGADEAGRHYAELAEATLVALLPAVIEGFAAKHGPPPGAGVCVMGMGSLGAGWLTAGSDLDLIVIYDSRDADASEGPRPLAVRPYYARLTQALVTALSAPTAEGKLYEIDLRLRPSGRQGPVATSLPAFEAYQREEAWAWEHMALTRARAIAGAAEVCAEVEAIRADTIATPRVAGEIWEELARMRERLAAAKPPAGPLDVKPGPGGLQDIELFGQALALLARSPVRGTAAQLQAAARAGLLAPAHAATLARTYRAARAVQSAGRLVLDGPLTADRLGAGAAGVITQAADAPDLADLSARLGAARAAAAALIDDAIAAGRAPA